MGVIGMVLMVVGLIAAFITGIMILVKAFQESVLWGVGSLLVPFVVLIFVIMHWQETGKLFLYNLGASVLMGVGVALAGMGSSGMPIN